MPVNIDEIHTEVSVEPGAGGAQPQGGAHRALPTPRDIERWRQAARSCAVEEARACAIDRDD
jgi:hypothetical protein